MNLREWIRNAFDNEGTTNKSIIYSMYDDACIDLDRNINIESYNRAVRLVFNEMFQTNEIDSLPDVVIGDIRNAGNVLVVGDIHEPFCKSGYMEFCIEQYKKHKCKTVVFIGDILDNHAISYHESDPNGMAASDEIEEAIGRLNKWYDAFPKAYVCMGNHDLLIERKARTHGLPQRFFKSFKEIIGAPKDWIFNYSFQIDGVKYMHGTGGGGQNAHIIRALKNRQSTVLGHFHSCLGVRYLASHHDLIFGMNVGSGIDINSYAMEYGKDFVDRPIIGCVDRDTEYLSIDGWKPIGDYNGELVGQYNSDGTVSFVDPIAYIKEPCKTLNEIKSIYGLHMKFCDEHTIIYINSEGNINSDTGKNIINRHNSNTTGFQGKFISAFNINTTNKLDLSDEEIRLCIAIQADGHMLPQKNKIRMAFRKDRKIKRLEQLLISLNLDYTKYNYRKDTIFTFYYDKSFKIFDYSWYHCNYNQLNIITDEVLHWDGNIKDNIYYSTIKENVDFIQYAFTATGNRTHINMDYRSETSTCYRVCISKSKIYRTICSTNKTSKFNKINTIDGYKYCFTVPSHMLILRTENSIYVTGNCGIVFEGKSAIPIPMEL